MSTLPRLHARWLLLVLVLVAVAACAAPDGGGGTDGGGGQDPGGGDGDGGGQDPGGDDGAQDPFVLTTQLDLGGAFAEDPSDSGALGPLEVSVTSARNRTPTGAFVFLRFTNPTADQLDAVSLTLDATLSTSSSGSVSSRALALPVTEPSPPAPTSVPEGGGDTDGGEATEEEAPATSGQIVAVTVDHGSCAQADAGSGVRLDCELGPLAAGASATVTLELDGLPLLTLDASLAG